MMNDIIYYASGIGAVVVFSGLMLDVIWKSIIKHRNAMSESDNDTILSQALTTDVHPAEEPDYQFSLQVSPSIAELDPEGSSALYEPFYNLLSVWKARKNAGPMVKGDHYRVAYEECHSDLLSAIQKLQKIMENMGITDD